MLSEQKINAYREDGFVLGSRVLDDAQIETLRQEMQRVIDDKDDSSKQQPVMLRNFGKEDAPVWQIVDIWMASDAFRDLAFNSTLVEEAAQLTQAKQLRVWHDQIQYKPETSGGVNNWHQDSVAWPPLQPKTEQITAWIALDDVDEDNGCMSMVPESQKWGPQSETMASFPSFYELPEFFEGHHIKRVLRPVKAGHVHYHHPLTWHGSHHNRSGRPRRAIAVHYMTEKTYHDASQQHVKSPWIEVGDGEMIAGDAFPLVYDGAPLAAPVG